MMQTESAVGGYRLTKIVGAPPLLKRAGKGTPTGETAALIRHVKSTVSDVPVGDWVMVVGPMSKKTCEKAANALSRHKTSGRVPENLKARVRETYDGGYGLWVRLEEDR